jgi:hypothetical protein
MLPGIKPQVISGIVVGAMPHGIGSNKSGFTAIDVRHHSIANDEAIMRLCESIGACPWDQRTLAAGPVRPRGTLPEPLQGDFRDNDAWQ